MLTPAQVSTAYTTLKAVGGVLKDAGKIELQGEILSLHRTLQEAVEDNTRLAADNGTLSRRVQELEEKIRQLEAATTRRDEMDFDGQMYWQLTNGQRTDGPFCQRCHDGPTQSRSRMVEKGTYMYCTVCNYGFRKLDAPPRVQKPRGRGWVNNW